MSIEEHIVVGILVVVGMGCTFGSDSDSGTWVGPSSDCYYYCIPDKLHTAVGCMDLGCSSCYSCFQYSHTAADTVADIVVGTAEQVGSVCIVAYSYCRIQ